MGEYTFTTLQPLIVSYTMDNHSNFMNHVEIEVQCGDSLIAKSTYELQPRDFYPFAENDLNLTGDNKLLVFISCLQYLEISKSTTNKDYPPILVNSIFGLLVCDTLPSSLRHFARKLALAMV